MSKRAKIEKEEERDALYPLLTTITLTTPMLPETRVIQGAPYTSLLTLGPIFKTELSTDSQNFFWYHAAEKNNSIVLYGKQNNKFHSITTNLPWFTIYIEPGEGDTISDVAKSLNHNISTWKFKECMKQHVLLDPDGPKRYIKVKMPKRERVTYPRGRVFGQNQSILETFLIKKKLKGPCWLGIITAPDPNFVIASLSGDCIVVQNFAYKYSDEIMRKIDPDIVVVFNNARYKPPLQGRLVCDVHYWAMELFPREREYSIEYLAKTYLQIDKYDKSHENDAYVQLMLLDKLQILSHTRTLTEIAGNLWAHTLANAARSERVEFLLMRAFHEAKNFILPDSESLFEKKSYTGGLVLTPKIGYYDKYVLLLDFNSLYPSIIQEFDICFAHNRVILPSIVKDLVERRRQVRETNPTLQLALKLTANSLYGCLGFSRSRFYKPELAALITQHGRQVLQATVDLIGSQVIYGDTDSVMIATDLEDYADVVALGEQLSEKINSKYKTLEIESDGIFKKLLLQKKKKYAGMLTDGTIVYKGMDVVRRDFCELAREIGKNMVQNIFSGLADETESFTIDPNTPLEKFVMYGKRNQESLKKRLRVKGDEPIPYVVCKGRAPVMERCYLPAEFVRADGFLELDIEWYTTHQIVPLVTRLKKK
jgi:DNA polymerase elongation subunit (family B)